MDKNPLIYLNHIIECISKICEYTDGLDEGAFLESRMVQDAVIRNFEIIGEATKQLKDSFRNKYPKVEWKKIAGLRDKLIHDYIGVDMWAVWAVVEDEIPVLYIRLREIIEQESPKNEK